MTAIELHHTLSGNFEFHKSFHSPYWVEDRDLAVYLPPGYSANLELKYPVCYLQDGQNLFDAATAFLGNEWGLDEAAEELIRSGQIQPLILVGIYNTGLKRLAEYTHVKDRRGSGGGARAYSQALLRDVKPFIDRQYRTLPSPVHTALGGSSLGGLFSLYLGLRRPDVFGKLIAMSPSVWWSRRNILGHARRAKYSPDQKIWLDVGTREGATPEIALQDVRDLRDVLVSRGWQPARNLRFLEDQGAEHNEAAWGRRMRDALRYLFPATPVHGVNVVA